MKRLITLILPIILLLSLTSCHRAAKMQIFTLPDSFDTSKEYNITFWAKNDTNKNQALVYENAAKTFHGLYPNITVSIKTYTDYTKIYQDVITNIATNTTPNVCITYPDHIATYLTGNGVVVPLDDLMDSEKFGFGGTELKFDGPAKYEITEKYLSEGYIGTSCYALPFMRSTEACYINKTYVEKLGFTVPEVLTWDFVWEVSEKATEKDENGNFKVNGQKVLIPFIYKSTDNMAIQMLKQQDAPYSDELGNVLIFTDKVKDILETVAKHTKTGAFSTFKISGYPANFLNAGQCIFAVDSTAGSTWMGTNAPLCDISKDKIVDFETVVRTVPQFDENNIKMISQGPSLCIFNKSDSREVLASWLFAQFLLTNEVQIPYAETEGYVPVTSKAAQSDEYQSYLTLGGSDNGVHYAVKADATRLLLDNTENTFVTPVFNGSASLREASGDMIESVTKSIRRHEEVDKAYYDNLFETEKLRYHLAECGQSANIKIDFGPLPTTAVILLSALVFVWIILILYFIFGKMLKNK